MLFISEMLIKKYYDTKKLNIAYININICLHASSSVCVIVICEWYKTVAISILVCIE